MQQWPIYELSPENGKIVQKKELKRGSQWHREKGRLKRQNFMALKPLLRVQTCSI